MKTKLENHSRAVAVWLFICAMLVFAMVVVGGLTRLTESGLSIVEWKPVTGTLPPLSVDAWNDEFAKYRESPQYQKINRGMSVEEFKHIFWLEYLHRLLGRVIGVVFFLPLVYFLRRKEIPPSLRPRLIAIFLLGAAQGVIGWYMVKSGLVDRPMVSPLRLAFHLSTAFVLFGLLVWSALDLCARTWQEPVEEKNTQFLKHCASFAVGLVLLQVILGALVAGLDAGLIYNSFPKMNGQWVPDELLFLNPWWINLVENPVTVQFLHRMGACAVAVFLLVFSQAIHRSAFCPRLRRTATILLVLLITQFSLGVFTLLYQVPIALASLHQAFALILFGQCVMIRHGFSRSPKTDGGPTAAPYAQVRE